MNLKNTVTETKDTITLHFDVEQLQQLPLKVSMKILEIIEKNSRINGKFTEFDTKTQDFIENNRTSHIRELSSEKKSFKDFSSLIFESVSGPLYVYADRVKEIVSSIYEKEKYFDNIEETKVPKIIYKSSISQENNNAQLIDVKNIDELISNFGKATTLHAMILFKDHANYEYKKLNKTDKTPYELSRKIASSCYDEELNIHPKLKTFEGKDYILEHLFNEQVKKINTPEEIFKMVLMKKDLCELISAEQEFLPTRPKMK